MSKASGNRGQQQQLRSPVSQPPHPQGDAGDPACAQGKRSEGVNTWGGKARVVAFSEGLAVSPAPIWGFHLGKSAFILFPLHRDPESWGAALQGSD